MMNLEQRVLSMVQKYFPHSPEADPSDFPPILDDFSITFVGKAPKKFWWKLRWMFFKVRVKALIYQIFHF